MNKTSKKYLILAIVIFCNYSLMSVLNNLGVRMHSWMGNALGAAWFCAPIVILLFCVGGDERINTHLRLAARVIGGFICVCFLLGMFATL